MWYETEEIDDPVLPFCSMLYQLAGKCNMRLKPSGRYNPSLYAYADDDNFILDACTIVENLNNEMADRQSWMKKWSDDMRMTRKSMSPAAKAGFVLSILFLAGLTVAICIYGSMKDIGSSRRANLKPEDIPEIPDFDYQKAEIVERKDSGVERARSSGRRMMPRALKVSRCRTTPQGL